MKRRKNERKDTNALAKENKQSAKKIAPVVDLTEKVKNSYNNSNTKEETAKNTVAKLKFTQILQDRIDGKFSDEDLRLLLLNTLSGPNRSLFHITKEELNTP